MRIDGEWWLSSDAETRPVFQGKVVAVDGSLVEVPLLADTGADRTVLSADALDVLGLPVMQPTERVAGIGGMVASVHVDAELRLVDTNGRHISFPGRFTALTDPDALDMSILGRDILQWFALIVDRPGNVVCLLNQNHRYSISAT